MPILHGATPRRLNLYDSLTFANQCGGIDGGFHILRGASSARLFGNANIGHAARCNLYVPGQVDNFDSPVRIDNWYARTDLPDLFLPRLMAAAHHARVDFIMGDQPQWTRSLAELLEAKPWMPPGRCEEMTWAEAKAARWREEHGAVPVIVPVRQWVSMRVDFYRRDLLEEVFEAYSTPSGGIMMRSPWTLWFHVEGRTGAARIEDTRSPVDWMAAAALDDGVAMRVVASWDPDTRAAVREEFSRRWAPGLAALVAESDERRRATAPTIYTLPDADIDD